MTGYLQASVEWEEVLGADPESPRRGEGSGPKSRKRPWVARAADHPEGKSATEAETHSDCGVTEI